jgi:hypothetical protein
MILWSIEEVEGEECLCLAHDADDPWRKFSPQYQHGQIPVPGMKGMYAESIQGLWEGMKLIGPKGKKGRINPGYFTGPGRFRALKEGEWCSGFSYDGRQIGMAEARIRIFLPCYVWMIQNHCADLLGNIKIRASRQDIWLYDKIGNVDPTDTSMEISHAAIVVAFLNNAVTELEQGAFPHNLMGSMLQ